MEEWIKQLPKLDLHCHLDGSVSMDTMETLLKKQGITMPWEELQNALEVSEDCPNLTQYLKKFDLPLKCLQAEEALRLAAFDLLKNAAAENVKYIEVRFAPSAHQREGLNLRQILESVLEGIKVAESQFSIKASVIVCAMRHETMENNLKMLGCSREYLGEGVCALDLAGDEITYPTKHHAELFLKAKELSMPFTIHSGECGSSDNVKDAINLGAKRIGHGIAMCKDASIMKLCSDKRIGIEMCPTSNLQTKAVMNWIEYPLSQFLEQGILATINTDNRTVSNTNMTKELIKVYNNLQLDRDIICQLLKNAVDIAFADDAIKNGLLKEMRL